ncbi:hypothetical protein AAMO2058_000149900 [Amorphochlora amoebiformis]
MASAVWLAFILSALGAPSGHQLYRPGRIWRLKNIGKRSGYLYRRYQRLKVQIPGAEKDHMSGLSEAVAKERRPACTADKSTPSQLPSTSFRRTRGRSGVFTFTPAQPETIDDSPELSEPSISGEQILLNDKGSGPKLSVLDHEKLIQSFQDNDVKLVHLPKIWGSLINSPDVDFNTIDYIPKKAKELLTTSFQGCTSRILQVETSQDNSTVKLVIELQDKQLIESVIIAHDNYNALCVSSQVGCRMGCRFCATGTMGLIRNLTTGEILEQLLLANKIRPIRNVVFMGMGEPLDNFDAVLGAIKGIHDTRMFNLGIGHITVSTVGIVPAMYRLADEVPKVALAVSLHAPDQDLRERLVPSGKVNRMDDILSAMDYYLDRSPHHSFIQYTVIDGVNDSEDHARSLARALRSRRVKVFWYCWV